MGRVNIGFLFVTLFLITILVLFMYNDDFWNAHKYIPRGGGSKSKVVYKSKSGGRDDEEDHGDNRRDDRGDDRRDDRREDRREDRDREEDRENIERALPEGEPRVWRRNNEAEQITRSWPRPTPTPSTIVSAPVA